jgi:DMSO/TMAO reductase YedYZ molybdopterin-dependent catalytic subunit
MPAVEIVAVNQCSGNWRGLFQPHVPGVEWSYGAMGCAPRKGVRLKDLLDKVGFRKNAIEVVLDGADGPVVDRPRRPSKASRSGRQWKITRWSPTR